MTNQKTTTKMTSKLTKKILRHNVMIKKEDNSNRIIIATLDTDCDNRPNDIIVTG